MSLIDDKRKHAKTVVVMQDNAQLILGEQVVMKIHYFHARVKRNTEWSGVLVYKTKSGSIADPKTWILEATDIVFMDVGTGSYTEYEFSSDDDYSFDIYTDALMNDSKIGHIHTHHSMSTFFSGTDMSELHDNSPNHNYYLSLIVNYKEPEDWMAKIAFCGEEIVKGKVMTTRRTFLDMLGFGTPVEKTIDTVTQVMYTIDCDLVLDEAIKPFYNRVTDICKPKPVATNYRGRLPLLQGSQSAYAGKQLEFNNWLAEEPVKDKQVIQTRSAGSYSQALVYPFVCKVLSTDLDAEDTTISALFKSISTAQDIEIEFLVDIIEDNYEEFIEKYFNLTKATPLDMYCISKSLLKVCETYDDKYLFDCLTNMVAVYINIDVDEDFRKKVELLTNIKDLEEWA